MLSCTNNFKVACTLFLIIFLFIAGCNKPRQIRQPKIKKIDSIIARRIADSLTQAIPFKVGEGLKLSLWASDSLVADPIGLSVDDQGRAYITRTNRQKNSEFDIRGHMNWATASISWKTPEDRKTFLHQEFSPDSSDKRTWLKDLNKDSIHDWRDLAVEQEEIYRIEDQSGNGFADFSQLYIRDFHDEITDVAGSALPVGDDVFVTVGPDTWRLRDNDGDGMADEKTSISHGYNVHVGFSGHGMSGLIQGPDGKIYWSVGDIGFHVEDQDGRTWAYPNQGAILRCNPDGSDFEVYAAGLRNTHEFVFDKYGNIISVDNDGDHPGEEERLVYIVRGSDAGWRANWQYGKYTDPDNNGYKVWMDEDMYKPRFEGQAAYFIPPIINYHSGPAGMIYNPGTALGEKWKDKFFIAEFTGSPARSSVFAFDLKPKGAGFGFVGEEEVLNGILATGLDVGPDGAFYVADWIDGWGTKNYGRIWKLDVEDAEKHALRAEVEILIKGDFAEKSFAELGQLLGHEDMRVRMKAQFELVERGDEGKEVFLSTMEPNHDQLARIHSIWGIGQLARMNNLDHANVLVDLYKDHDAEIRAQAAKIIGDVKYKESRTQLIPLLKDESDRVKFFAAEAIGRTNCQEGLMPIIKMLEANDDQDIYLRHAGSYAMAELAQADFLIDTEEHPLLQLHEHPSRALRIAAVITLRKLRHWAIARYLKDEDEYIVTEAARAINDDLSIEEALPDLAQLLATTSFTHEALIRRAINANLRVGQDENLNILADYAMNPKAPEAMRAEAISCIGVWAKPSVLDRVDGRYRGEVKRDPVIAQNALKSIIQPLFASNNSMIQEATATATGKLGLQAGATALFELFTSRVSSEVKIASLQALSTLESQTLGEAMQIALEDVDAAVRKEALSMIPQLELAAEEKVSLLSSLLGNSTMDEQQAVLTALGTINSQETLDLLSRQLDKFIAGDLEAELSLELIEAIETMDDPQLNEKWEDFQASIPQDQPLAVYKSALYGGNPRAGRRIFYRNAAAQCVRCHAIGDYGGDVGPKLSNIANELTREQLLESLVDPSARISPGYGVVSIAQKNGMRISGTLIDETASEMAIKTSSGAKEKILKSEVEAVQEGPSSMPPMGTILSRRELRDLVAFLSELKV